MDDVATVTVATVEQGLLNNIQLILNHEDPDNLYMDVEGLHVAVAAYGKFQDAQMVKAQIKTLNPLV